MFGVSPIEKLKRKAAKAYVRYHKSLDGMDCGRALGEFISNDTRMAKQEFNDAMDKLAKIDPTTPKTRL